MRILAWNVNHRAGVLAIPEWLVPAIAAEVPDVLMCTEYVRGTRHVELLRELRAAGLPDSDVTAPRHPGSNCILVAAREPLLGGLVQPPLDSDPAVQAGFVHVVLEKSAVHLFGFRMPDASEMVAQAPHECDWLGDAMEPYLHEPAILVADVDVATADASECSEELGALMHRGWRLASAREGASFFYAPKEGERRIQLAFVSPGLTVSDAEYRWSFRGLSDEVKLRRVGIPDHAMLIVDVERATIPTDPTD